MFIKRFDLHYHPTLFLYEMRLVPAVSSLEIEEVKTVFSNYKKDDIWM